MESRQYWLKLSRMKDAHPENGQIEDNQADHLKVSSRNPEKIIYNGRLISEDVYLAVPTFIRRGITITI